MLLSMIIDENALEHVVSYHTEGETQMEGFELVSVNRFSDHIDWRFKREITEDCVYTGSTVLALGLFGLKEAVRLEWCGSGCQLFPGDVLYVNYTMRWEWRDGDDDNYVVLPGPAPGAKLHFEFCLCA